MKGFECAKFVLVGAALAPLAVGAVFTVFVAPVFIAERVLKVSPFWGLLVTVLATGGIMGALVCWRERQDW
jgi:hypothetical protein